MKKPKLNARQLALDRQHGASFLLRQALLILRDEATELSHKNRGHYLQELAAAARRLQYVRPAMASITNGLQLFIDELPNPDLLTYPDGPVAAVTGLVDDILARLDQYYQDTVLNGLSLIQDGFCLLTCSFSATVCAALTEAARRDLVFTVFILESDPQPGDLAYGEMAATVLENNGVTCRLGPVSEIYSLKQPSLALVGADSILPDGSLINGWPSLDLAQACHHRQLPFYVLCESIKFASTYPSKPLERGFECIPSSLITAIVTER